MAACNIGWSLPCACPVRRCTCVVVLTQNGPVLGLLACSHNALVAWMSALALGCNGSGDTSAMPLCHLLATHVITCVWPAAVHPRIGAIMSRQALITPRTNGVHCAIPCSPVSSQHGPVKPCPALTIRLLRISSIWLAPSCFCTGLFSLFCKPTSPLICPLASHLQHLGSSQYSIPSQHSFHSHLLV